MPAAHAVRKPGPKPATVKLNDTAFAPAGMPHVPTIGKSRTTAADSAGCPYAPTNPFPRVSATRHGVIATNGSAAGASARAVRPEALGACETSAQKGGAVHPVRGASSAPLARAPVEIAKHAQTTSALRLNLFMVVPPERSDFTSTPGFRSTQSGGRVRRDRGTAVSSFRMHRRRTHERSARDGQPDRAPVVAVVVPAFRTASSIRAVIEGIPRVVQHVIVVDDASPDDIGAAVSALSDPRIVLVRHETNRGVGGAMKTGFDRALELGADVVVKLDSDGQMDPSLIPSLVAPLAEGDADFAKGNRFADITVIGMAPMTVMSAKRFPFAKSASPSASGATSDGIREGSIWPSLSSLTTTSAPSSRARSKPVFMAPPTPRFVSRPTRTTRGSDSAATAAPMSSGDASSTTITCCTTLGDSLDDGPDRAGSPEGGYHHRDDRSAIRLAVAGRALVRPTSVHPKRGYRGPAIPSDAAPRVSGAKAGG